MVMYSICSLLALLVLNQTNTISFEEQIVTTPWDSINRLWHENVTPFHSDNQGVGYVKKLHIL